MTYKVTREDLLNKLPIAKILQSKHGTKKAYNHVRPELTLIKNQFKNGYIPLITAQNNINTVINLVRERYPEEFNTIGWYDKQVNIVIKPSQEDSIPTSRKLELITIIEKLTSNDTSNDTYHTLKDINTLGKQLNYHIFTIYELSKLDTILKRTVRGYKYNTNY